MRAVKKKMHAQILSCKDVSGVNPLGSPLAPKDRSGNPTQLPASGDRWRIEWACEDDSIFTAVVTTKVWMYQPGTKGLLTIKGDSLKKWEPDTHN